MPVSEVAAKNHEVVHKPSGKKLGYGALAKAAAKESVPARETLRLKDPKDFRYIGKGNLKLVDGPGHGHRQSEVRHRHPTGRHALRGYRSAPGPRRQGGECGRFRLALKVPGVVKVVQIKGARRRRSSIRSAAWP